MGIAVSPVLEAAIADASVEAGRVLHVTFVDGRRASLPITELPFSTGGVEAARASMDGSFVTLDGTQGSFDVTAHELSALEAGRSLTRPGLDAVVADNIRAIRGQQGISLRELARRSGIAAPNLSNFENGRVSPRLETLGRVADALNVSVARLVVADNPHAE